MHQKSPCEDQLFDKAEKSNAAHLPFDLSLAVEVIPDAHRAQCEVERDRGGRAVVPAAHRHLEGLVQRGGRVSEPNDERQAAEDRALVEAAAAAARERLVLVAQRPQLRHLVADGLPLLRHLPLQLGGRRVVLLEHLLLLRHGEQLDLRGEGGGEQLAVGLELVEHILHHLLALLLDQLERLLVVRVERGLEPREGRLDLRSHQSVECRLQLIRAAVLDHRHPPLMRRVLGRIAPDAEAGGGAEGGGRRGEETHERAEGTHPRARERRGRG
mmetsp:Transcript_10704/g.23830  ORF Transcript_10704/g.23830 Transcript_10704/m.23830 type:complete len:271 (+) Transcript_10704:396-1208(+)